MVKNALIGRREGRGLMICCHCCRFVFFHAFFTTKKASADIAETNATLAVPLDDRTRGVLINSFFG